MFHRPCARSDAAGLLAAAADLLAAAAVDVAARLRGTAVQDRDPVGSPDVKYDIPRPSARTAGPKIAHIKVFWELAWASMRQIWLKIALNHLFEHPKWHRKNFTKKSFDHFWTHR